MANRERLSVGITSLEDELNKWAREEGIISATETLVVEVRLQNAGGIGKMRVEEFFTRRRLKEAGAAKFVPCRVLDCLHWNVFRTTPNMTMDEFLQAHDVESLMRWKKCGIASVRAMVNAIKQAGAEISDPDNLFD